MKRGIIMSIQENQAVVMTSDGQFLKAPLHGAAQIGEELLFDEEQRPRPRIHHLSYRYAGIAAIFMIMLLGCLLYAFNNGNPVVAYVTLDINPSVEIGVDSSERVVELRGLNEDGIELIQGMAYKGKSVETVTTALFEAAREAHYMETPNRDIVITRLMLRSGPPEFDNMLTENLNQQLDEWLSGHASSASNITITSLSVPKELRAEADANGISSGKMAVYLMAKSEGYEITLDQLKEQSIDTVTESIGGVQTLIEEADDAAINQRLQKLLEQEKQEKETESAQNEKDQEKNGHAASAQNSGKATGEPSAKPSKKPALSTSAPSTPHPTEKHANGPKQKPDFTPGASTKSSENPGGNWHGKGGRNGDDQQWHFITDDLQQKIMEKFEDARGRWEENSAWRNEEDRKEDDKEKDGKKEIENNQNNKDNQNNKYNSEKNINDKKNNDKNNHDSKKNEQEQTHKEDNSKRQWGDEERDNNRSGKDARPGKNDGGSSKSSSHASDH